MIQDSGMIERTFVVAAASRQPMASSLDEHPVRPGGPPKKFGCRGAFRGRYHRPYSSGCHPHLEPSCGNGLWLLSCGVPPQGRPEIQVSVTLCGVRNSAGEVAATSALIRDISERQRAEQAQAYLAAIVESSEDAIMGWNHRQLEPGRRGAVRAPD